MLLGARQFFERRGAPTPPGPYDAEVEYIDSVIPAYIDTGFGSRRDYTVRLDAAFLPGAAVFSSMLGTQNDYFYCIRIWEGLSRLQLYWTGGFHHFIVNDVSDLYKRYVFIFSRDGIYVGDTQIVGQTSGVETDYTIKLTGYNEGNTQRQGLCRYWGFSITDGNGDKVIDLTPVRIGSVGYMYDSVSGNVFGNANLTGTFTPGPDKS